LLYPVGCGFDNYQRIIFKCAIDNSMFDIGVCLAVNRFDVSSYVGGTVVSSSDDGDFHVRNILRTIVYKLVLFPDNIYPMKNGMNLPDQFQFV